ncbi:hypothetical protein ACFODO_16450 [Acinetobacter sichuanensis]|uniref:Uncharacterized protein n=1 Tax=Acinetobacter sichuanensis TaxID=2136183 RepID=A0A371YIR7_9GAMM|nr:hypothetical protein [Acinetobacter sichuanensis]RFC81379.1 hypothetical protein C9E89_022195 [Acinetobacter sichuanensis]
MFFEKLRHLMLNVSKFILQKVVMEAKDSIRLAKASLLDMFEDEKPLDVRLEEIELDDSDKWLVTLSYYKEPTGQSTTGLMAIASALNSASRDYKVITIDKNSGKVESIKIRKNG